MSPPLNERGQGVAREPQAGVALAIVVWFIAGMSLLVAGIVYQAKQDIRMAQVHLSRAKAAASGDGAIQLMMSSLVDGALYTQGAGVTGGQSFRLGDDRVTVQLVPAAGLININSAPLDLLVYLFEGAGVAAGYRAEVLADNVIQWRTATGGRTRSRRFQSVEDLLRVPGFDRVGLEALRDYVTASDGGGLGVEVTLAPEPVLRVFARKDPGKVDEVRRRREELRDGASSGASPARGAGVYRADAVLVSGGKRWLRRRWVRVGNSAHSRLPWHFIRTEAPRVVGAG